MSCNGFIAPRCPLQGKRMRHVRLRVHTQLPREGAFRQWQQGHPSGSRPRRREGRDRGHESHWQNSTAPRPFAAPKSAARQRRTHPAGAAEGLGSQPASPTRQGAVGARKRPARLHCRRPGWQAGVAGGFDRAGRLRGHRASGQGRCIAITRHPSRILQVRPGPPDNSTAAPGQHAVAVAVQQVAVLGTNTRSPALARRSFESCRDEARSASRLLVPLGDRR